MKFSVPDMSCSHCKAAVEAALAALDAAARVTVDLENKTVTVESGLPAEKIAAALEAAGYPARPLD